MGLTYLEVEVGNPANPDVTERIKFLVDSGAIYSVIPKSVLDKLGIKPVATQEFILASISTVPNRTNNKSISR